MGSTLVQVACDNFVIKIFALALLPSFACVALTAAEKQDPAKSLVSNASVEKCLPR